MKKISRRLIQKKLANMIQAKKELWEEFEKWETFYTREFILKKANEIDNIIIEIQNQLD